MTQNQSKGREKTSGEDTLPGVCVTQLTGVVGATGTHQGSKSCFCRVVWDYA